MFHIKSLELVHWDYWQRVKNIPLDAKIITIAGQNGSGKTTLLDALRTLFGLDCSMGRTYKHYARHSGQSMAWIRAVVDNQAVGRQMSNRPFRASGFMSEDAVTLFCQIQKNGGDWKRQYLLRGGDVEIEEVQNATDWLGVEKYRQRLAYAGLSPAMAKVLALEQGETDKLCEYAPRQLLDLVFDVFGDKEVLDAYDEAKRHQRDTEQELKQFEAELDVSKTNLETLRLRVANFEQWDNKNKERSELVSQILPSLQFVESKNRMTDKSRQLRDAKLSAVNESQKLELQRKNLATLAHQFSESKQKEVALENEQNIKIAALDELNKQLKPLENIIAQKDRLEKLAAQTGQNIVEATQKLDALEPVLTTKKQQRSELQNTIAEHIKTIDALSSKTGVTDPDNVQKMRRQMEQANIAYVMLADVIEVTDKKWQGAVEGVLKSYAYVMLLENKNDASRAFTLAEQAKYPHFIVPDRIAAQQSSDASLLGVVQFNAPVPSWLVEQLKRIRRVDSVQSGLESGADEWITPDAFHRERRGGRSLFIEPSRYRFGHAGKTQRLEALRANLPQLESQEDALTLQISELVKQVSDLKTVIAGVDAAKELHARLDEFDEAQRAITPLLQSRQTVGTRLGELASAVKLAGIERAGRERTWGNEKAKLEAVQQQENEQARQRKSDRLSHAKQWRQHRAEFKNLPANWRQNDYLNALVQKHINAHQVELRIDSVDKELASNAWEKDGTIVDQHHRLNNQLIAQQTETDERRYQNNRAIEATGNARAAYIERLRYTVKLYAKNIKQLGELAGIDVHVDNVRLENDDVHLAQAGLHVKFKFDGKNAIGMNDGEASGGQQVMKSLILLIGLLKSEDGSGGFVFIDEPFAHLDIRNIQLVGEFLKNTDAQYLMTTPLTHNTDVYDPSELTLITSKKKKEMPWAQPIFVLQRRAKIEEQKR